jgi:hypothetical protein
MISERGKFRNPMDEGALRNRLGGYAKNVIYNLAVEAAGHQSAYTVDKLSFKLKQILPGLISELASEVERENCSQNVASEPVRQ